MRKALQAKQKKAEMQKQIKDLENECNGLEKSVYKQFFQLIHVLQVKDLESKIVKTEQDEKERQAQEEKAHQETVEQLRKHNKGFKEELEKLLSKKG